MPYWTGPGKLQGVQPVGVKRLEEWKHVWTVCTDDRSCGRFGRLAKGPLGFVGPGRCLRDPNCRRVGTDHCYRRLRPRLLLRRRSIPAAVMGADLCHTHDCCVSPAAPQAQIHSPPKLVFGLDVFWIHRRPHMGCDQNNGSAQDESGANSPDGGQSGACRKKERGETGGDEGQWEKRETKPNSGKYTWTYRR